MPRPISELYNRKKLIRFTMRKFNVDIEKAEKAVDKFLADEDERIQDVDKTINEVLARSLNSG